VITRDELADPIEAALWEGAMTACTCGRPRRKVDGNAPTVCKGCDNFPWNCHCEPVRRRSAPEPEDAAPDLDDDEEEF
jgi:hypothetical protein